MRPYSLEINILKLPFAPYKVGFNRSEKVSPHLTLGEIYDSSKSLNKNDFLKNGIPIHKNFIKAFELIRSATGKPVYLGSLFRTHEWEIFRERSGDSKHVLAEAFDINGEDVKQLLTEALEKKNDLYFDLRALGVNAFGSYDWGYHLDFRQNKESGEIYYWDNTKKKDKIEKEFFIIPILLFFAFLFRKPILKMCKNG